MQPAYRDGTVIIVSPAARSGAATASWCKTRDGEVMAQGAQAPHRQIGRAALAQSAHAERTLAVDDVLWIARIVWASQ